MASISSVNISKVSQSLSFNSNTGNQGVQQNNLNGLNDTQSSKLIANISKSIADTDTSKMQSSEKRNIQLEKRAEGGFGAKNEDENENGNVENSADEPIKRLNKKA